jgi:hypothetical protein
VNADGVPTVVVAMLTYRRAEGLQRALPPLVEQAEGLRAARARVVVVDNDPAGGARAAVERVGRASVQYVHEPRPGIAAARNAALRAAHAAEAVVFIDDDEVPRPGWLESLVGCWRAWGCAGVAGPARRTFESAVEPWVERSGFFVRTTRPTGAVVPGASTNNLLLDLRVLRSRGLWFDERFGLTGGSDTLLTRTLTRSGHEIRWCDEAEVLDPVPVARATRTWVLRRSFRTGTTWSRVHLALLGVREPAPRMIRLRTVLQRLELTARGVVRILRALPLAVAAACGGGVRNGPASQCRVASGLGMLLGAWGMTYAEYRRTAG